MPKMQLSFYDTKWNWLNIQLRRNNNNDTMLIVPFKSDNISQVAEFINCFINKKQIIEYVLFRTSI